MPRAFDASFTADFFFAFSASIFFDDFSTGLLVGSAASIAWMIPLVALTRSIAEILPAAVSGAVTVAFSAPVGEKTLISALLPLMTLAVTLASVPVPHSIEMQSVSWS